MTHKNLARTLLVAALALSIVLSVTGGTIAWFTDSVESTGNVIESGNLSIDILLQDNEDWISLKEHPETKVFDYNLWEPGFTQYEALNIKNTGNLALKYELHVIPGEDEVKSESGKSLAEAIDVYMAFGAQSPASFAEIASSASWWHCGTLADLIANEQGFTQGVMLPHQDGQADGLLETGMMQGECVCTVALHMQEAAGNEFQGLSLGNLGFKLVATQATVEEDSFDNQYDKDAEYPAIDATEEGVRTAAEFVAAFENIQSGTTVKLLNDIDLGDVDIELKDFTITGEKLDNLNATVNAFERANAEYTIDLNGFELSATDTAIELHGGTLNIKNGSISVGSADQGGTFISVGGHSPSYGTHKVSKCALDEYNAKSVLNLENVTFEGTMLTNTTGTTTGHIVYVDCYAQVHIRNCSFKTMMENGVYANHIDVNMNAARGGENFDGKATAVYVYEGTKFYGDPTYQAFKNVVNTDWEAHGGNLVFIEDGCELQQAAITDGDVYAWYTVVRK